MTRAHPEQQLQISVARFLDLALRPPTIWTAFPAGGGGRMRGAFLKAMGLKAGWPDLLVIHPRRTGPMGSNACTLLGIELKAARGRASPAQLAMCKAFEDAGGDLFIARSIDEVEGFLRGVGIPLHATSTGTPGAERGPKARTSEPSPTLRTAA
jgi:hypothetical protein